MKLNTFKATVTGPFGKFIVAVESDSLGARADIYSAALAELRCHIGLLKIGDVAKSSRRITLKMDSICEWAWIRKTK